MCLSWLRFQPCAGSEPDCNCCLSNKYTYMQLRSPEVTRVNFHLSAAYAAEGLWGRHTRTTEGPMCHFHQVKTTTGPVCQNGRGARVPKRPRGLCAKMTVGLCAKTTLGSTRVRQQVLNPAPDLLCPCVRPVHHNSRGVYAPMCQ